MTNKVKYTDAPADAERSLDRAVIAGDVLPSPDQLIRKTEKERITIAINKRSLDLFRKYAKQHDAKYQTMINDVVETYAEKFLTRR